MWSCGQQRGARSSPKPTRTGCFIGGSICRLIKSLNAAAMPSNWSCSNAVHEAIRSTQVRVCYARAMHSLEQLATANDSALVKCLQNISVVLGKNSHWELSLGYALAAVRLLRPPPVKAVHRAAIACQHLDEPLAALWYGSQVQRSH